MSQPMGMPITSLALLSMQVTLTHSQTVPIPDAMHAAWLLESPLLLGAGRDGRLKLWDTFRRTHLGSLELGCWASRSTLEVLRNGAPDRRVEKGVGDHAIYALAVHPDGRHLVIGAADGVHILSGVDAAVAAWKAGKSAADVMDSFEHTGRLPGCHAPVACVACSPCGNFVAAGSMSEGFITIWTSNHTAQDRSHGPHPATGWDATSCQRIASINERVYELCFSADSNMLAAGGGGPTLQLLLHMPSRPGTSRVDPHPQPGTDSHPQPGTVAASFGGILPGASMIAPAQDAWATAALLAAKAWPAGPATWEKSISTTLCKREGVTSVAFSPGGGLVLGGCSQGRLALWKVPSEKDLEQNVLHAEHSKQSVPTCKPISFWSLPSGKDIGSVRGLCFQSPANKGAVSSTSLPTDAVILLALTHGAGTAASAKTPPNSANAAQAAAKGLRPKLLVIGLLEKGGLQLWDLLKPTVKGPQAATLRSLEEATLQQW